MKCPLCGFEFREEEGLTSCAGCALSKSCSLVKCPNCSYEIPKEPGLIKALRKWKERRNEAKR